MPSHTPVLLSATLEILKPEPGESVLDVTLGLGGHADSLLEATAPGGFLTALDADAQNLAAATSRLEKFAARVTLIHANFSALPDCLPDAAGRFDIILADLGLSSPHLDDADRGFSFRANAPLDMRFDRSTGETAAQLIGQSTEQELVKIFQVFGELSGSRKLAGAIVDAGKQTAIETTEQLNAIVTKVYSYRANAVLPQVYQALRIAVNHELDALAHLLAVAPSLLRDGGRLAIISYHSLEDRMVKRAFKALTQAVKDEVTGADATAAPFQLLTRHAIKPAEQEVGRNPRSRSAKLRAILRLSQV